MPQGKRVAPSDDDADARRASLCARGGDRLGIRQDLERSNGVFYMAHIEGIGDTPFVSDGEFCGMRGQSRRVEGLQVRVVRRC